MKPLRVYFTAILGMFIVLNCSSSKEAGSSSGANQNQFSFENLDTNVDQQISLGEFKAKIPARRRSPEEVFRMIDQDSSGMISRAEYDVFRERMQQIRERRSRNRW